MQRIWVSLAVLVAAVWAVWWWSEALDPDSPAVVTGARDTLRARDAAVPGDAAWSPPSPPQGWPPSDTCEPRETTVCHAGDSWWRDGCGQLEAKAEECGAQLCRSGACERPDPGACAGLPAAGRCDGDVARGCHAGRPYAQDCGALGKVCVMGEEGARCAAPPEHPCRPDEPAYCSDDGETLFACRAGGWVELGCALHGARCMAVPEGDGVACIEAVTASAAAEEETPPIDWEGPWPGCGPCGCSPDAVERCNGTDDDSDGDIDEGQVCEPVPLVAYVISDAGASSYAQADLDAELERIHAAFRGLDGLFSAGFAWLDTVVLDRPGWLDLDDAEVDVLSREVAGLAAGTEFHIPVVFTDQLIDGEVPKQGLSTLPNGHCGGVRRDAGPQPPHGIVVVAKARSETTVAHEIGHYLGLCHTHGELLAVQRMRVDDGEVQRCHDRCEVEGDGICDTPADPGPESCAYSASCHVQCQVSAAPDPTNIMSYYTSCRSGFSLEQARQMRRGLDLRRAWFPCLSEAGCACEPGAAACPTQMSCRPFQGGTGQQVWRCGLDGSVAAGAACDRQGDCGPGAVCLGNGGLQRCVRTCTGSSTCRCRTLGGLPFSVCAEDLGA